MLLLPQSLRAFRYLRMGIASFICASCFLLGWPFMSHAHALVSALPVPLLSASTQALARAALPGVLGLFLWSVSTAFFFFTLIKIDFKNKERHLPKVFLVHKIGLLFLWSTVPISILWLVAVLLAGA
jgi:hypothetical protein